ASAAAAGAALMWANLNTFEQVLEPQTARSLTLGAATLAVCAALFAIIGWFRRSSGRRIAWALCLLIVVTASVTGPMAMRGPATIPPLEARPLDATLDAATPERTPRVTLIA